MIEVKNGKVKISGGAVEILSEISLIFKLISEEEKMCDVFMTVRSATMSSSKEMLDLVGINEYEDKVLSEVTRNIVDSVMLLKSIDIPDREEEE